MKVQLEIPEGEVGKSVVDILGSLSYDDKKELARQVMKEWLEKASGNSEMALRVKELLVEIRAKKDSYYTAKSDDDIKDSYAFKEALRSWKSSHEKMTEEVTRAVADFYKEQVREVVQRDPRTVAMAHEVAQLVKEQLPKAVHDAMVAWFLKHSGGVLEGLGNATALLGNLDEFKRDMTNRLGQVAQRVGM